MNYGRDPHKVETQPHGVRFTSDALDISLQADVTLRAEGQDAGGEFGLAEGQSALFVLEANRPSRAEPAVDLVDTRAAEELNALLLTSVCTRSR